jgi:hypothetical protein
LRGGRVGRIVHVQTRAASMYALALGREVTNPWRRLQGAASLSFHTSWHAGVICSGSISMRVTICLFRCFQTRRWYASPYFAVNDEIFDAARLSEQTATWRELMKRWQASHDLTRQSPYLPYALQQVRETGFRQGALYRGIFTIGGALIRISSSLSVSTAGTAVNRPVEMSSGRQPRIP